MDLISLIVYLIVVGLIFGLVWWFLGVLAIPEPFGKIVRILVALIAFLIVLSVLLQLLGVHTGLPSVRLR